MDIYLIIKWWHIIAVISWMAGVLYLWRLLVYHAKDYGLNSSNHKLLCVMEKRLASFITRPAMLITWLTGLAMAGLNHQIASSFWFIVKLLLVVILSFVSELACGYCKRLRKLKTLDKTNQQKILPSARKLKWINEIPTVLIIIIVALVILKPFY